MGKIVKATDKQGNVQYPITIAEAVVYKDSTGEHTVKQKLDDIASKSGVTGVKGNSETSYRTGEVNITKANIGLGNVENTALSTWTGSANLTTCKEGTFGSAATKTAGSASGNVPVNGAALGTTANVPVVTNTSGQLIPHASGALGTAAFTESSAYLPSSTNYAGSSSKGGAATSANKVNKSLTIGSKTFDGSAAVTITAADLGLTNATILVGTSTTDPKGSSGATVSGHTTWKKGEIVRYGTKEYLLDGDTNVAANWTLLGDEGSYAVKATTLAGYGITDAYTKTQTDKQISDALGERDFDKLNIDANETLSWVQQEDGKVTAEKQSISITKSQVSDFPSWSAATSKPTYNASEVKLPSDYAKASTGSTTFTAGTTTVSSAIGSLAKAVDEKVAANTAITGATKCKVTYDSKGLVTAGADLAASDIPSLPASKITSGTFADARIASAATWNAKQDALAFDGTYNATTNKVLLQSSTDSCIFFDTKIDGTHEIAVSNDADILAAVIAGVSA